GLAVDSTVHYMARLILELRGETDQVAALVRTVRTVGVPIVYTTVALFLGFLTFAFSSFVPIQNFGILTGFTMAAALGANLVLLPALLATTKVITLWDLVGVKLGEQPARTIPLFAGLRPAQARIVVLMGDLQVLAVDERFLRRIQLRYPRIASKVFLNLTRVLSDRLQRTTEQYVALVPEQRATAH